MTSSHGLRTRSRSRCRSDANTPLARGRPKNETLRVRVIRIGDDHVERRWRADPGRAVAGSREDRGVRGSARWHEPIDPQRRRGGRQERPVVAAAGDVGGGRGAAVVEVPQPDQAGLRSDLGVLGGLDLGQVAGDVPDPDLVDDALEEAGRRRRSRSSRCRRRRAGCSSPRARTRSPARRVRSRAPSR